MKNRVQLIGHVGQEPEVKTITGGKKVAQISIATNDFYYKENGDKVEQTEWHRVTAWGKTAEVIEKFVKKGKEIAIEGKLSYKTYDDRDGNKKYVTDLEKITGLKNIAKTQVEFRWRNNDIEIIIDNMTYLLSQKIFDNKFKILAGIYLLNRKYKM